MIDSIFEWSPTARATIAAIVGTSTAILAALAYCFGDLAMGENHPASRELGTSALDMGARRILRAWHPPKKRRLAIASYLVSALAFACAAFGLVLVSAAMSRTDSFEWVDRTGQVAAWLSVVFGGAGVVQQLALVRVVRRWSKTGAIWWLGLSVALFCTAVRFTSLGLVGLYVLTAGAALGGSG
jgi:hypothetical protein